MKLKNAVYFATLMSLSISLLLFSSCTRHSNGSNTDIKIAGNIVSTRAQNTTHLIAIIKLKNPALFESAQKQDGRSIINEKLLHEINREQDAATAALKALSTEIQIIYRYKMVLNAIAVKVPISLADKIKALGIIAYSENSGVFSRPETFALSNSVATPAFTKRNSAKFIGAEKLNLAGITGKGVKVGIIDTGIDYTHSMLLGEGTEEAYKAIDPAVESSAFPNKKVVGGIDLVGTAYNAASPDFQMHIPKPDLNPLDEAGHGTHVAGTVAGIGDGIHTYNGMAPDADLHAIKVFGASGSTSDFVVIAALEYAADPNSDGANADQLDVVNLSLGSSYGNPRILYTEAIKNLVNGGTVVVASAGNSGHKNYIVGAPGTASAALSVAASVDDADHLWMFKASRLNLYGKENGEEKLLVEAIEAATTRRIEDAPVSGQLVFLGLAAADLSVEEKAAVKGNVALIDRGQVSFNDKIRRAVEAGAIGVVVGNNSAGAPFVMGTTDKFAIPAIMITLDDMNKVKAAMKLAAEAAVKLAAVTIDFKTDETIQKPELIDTLTSFTSKGPRSIDGFIKPEVSAPGENIISADMGGGNKAVQMSGTSMAAPHIAGVMALIKQAHKTLTATELKSLVMGTTKTISDNKNSRYPVSQQGAGRVQADRAAESKVLVTQTSISLGEVSIETKKVLRRQLNIKNISNEKLDLKLAFEGNEFISLLPTSDSSAQLSLAAGAEIIVVINLVLDATNMKDEKIREMDGWVKLMQGETEIYRIPVLAVAHKLSSLAVSHFVVNSTSELDSGGALAELTLVNKNTNQGEALLFNLIGQDERKPKAEDFMSSDCDLQSAGYRIITRKNSQDIDEDFLQVGVKLYKPMTTWHTCDISLLIDANQDGIPEQELLGSNLKSIPGQKSDEFATTLIDATKAREIRKEYEQSVAEAKDVPEILALLKDSEDYKNALLSQSGLKLFNNSSVVVLEISTNKLALTTEGALAFKLIVTHNEQNAVEFDDHLNTTVKTDMRISLDKMDQSFLDLPEAIALSSLSGGGQNSNQKIMLTKGEGKEKLLVLFPNNKFSLSNLHEDSQSQILTPVYLGVSIGQ